ncbi:MAG TPA: group I intron-associated PD-(D/E)XK endonuclease [Solirubrobacterales bacterium]|nr:group I intron-associated PD-(D/E)XK endonuclease [Solirubrobacterales bacterium]
MERLINRRQQGDLGEASAIEWFTRAGAVVSAPLGHSPDYDLIADLGAGPLRVQAKTSVCRRLSRGQDRWVVALCTRGGNRSWQGVSKNFDAASIDYLFVLVGDGRRWLIPASGIGGRTNIKVGGARYQEFEIDAARPIDELIYGGEGAALDLPLTGGAPKLESRAGL